MRFFVKNRGYRTVLEQLEELMADQEIVEIYEDYIENVTDGNSEAAAILVLAVYASRLIPRTKGEAYTNEPKVGEK